MQGFVYGDIPETGARMIDEKTEFPGGLQEAKHDTP